MSLIQQLLAIAERWIQLQVLKTSQGSANPLGPLPPPYSTAMVRPSQAMARKLEHKKLTNWWKAGDASCSFKTTNDTK